jgi:putative photosynthetic complex assembly protein
MQPSTAVQAQSSDKVPTGALLAAAALIAVTVLGVAAVRLSGVSIHTPDAAPVTVRELRFEDRSDGGVIVQDARSGATVTTLTGEQGFVRGALRSLARERHLRGVGNDRPFELIGRADGRLTLVDPATGQRLDLESFGPTNAGAFARLLQPPR